LTSAETSLFGLFSLQKPQQQRDITFEQCLQTELSESPRPDAWFPPSLPPSLHFVLIL